MAEVVLEHVNKFYDGKKVHAVKDLSLKIEDGEFVALLGPSGCGKTSTLRMIAGLETINSGHIYIGGQLVNHMTPAQRNIAMAFENFGLYNHFTVYGNIAYPLKLRGWSSTDIEKKVRQVARLLDIEDILDRKPPQLGSGHQQRVSLARALVRDPAVFLLDEPISHLDAELRGRMRGELKRLHRDLGATMIYVTHDQLEAMSMADRVAVMNLGELQQVGTPSEIYHQPANMFVADFIGQPSINFIPCCPASKDGSLSILVAQQMNLPVPEHYHQAVYRAGQADLVLGVRPQAVRLSPGEREGGLKGSVYVVEPLGEYAVVTVRVGEIFVRAITVPTFTADHDTPATLSFNEREIMLFDKATGKELGLAKQ
jgi:multiple sugar transport system ATP-binding protein